MILWHVSAVARLYGKTLDEIAEANIDKLQQLCNVDGESRTRVGQQT
jgi:hypothetical protein